MPHPLRPEASTMARAVASDRAPAGSRVTLSVRSVKDEGMLYGVVPVDGARAALPREARELRFLPLLVRRHEELHLYLVEGDAARPRREGVPDLGLRDAAVRIGVEPLRHVDEKDDRILVRLYHARIVAGRHRAARQDRRGIQGQREGYLPSGHRFFSRTGWDAGASGFSSGF